jgi:hypothetical protein
MLAIVGTVPNKELPLLTGEVRLDIDSIIIEGKRVPINRGTPALLAAALSAGKALGHPPPFAYLVGDIGLGDGSRKLYDYLTRTLSHSNHQVITFHYLQPDVDWHNKVLFAIQEMPSKPTLIADAGFMYAAKMSGQAGEYDFFTPDVGEMAFLADEEAPHPFYTRGFILHEEAKLPNLITRAYKYKNAARFLLVKGKKDYVTDNTGVLSTVDDPSVEALEAIGGTGDTLTGILSALIQSGITPVEAATISAKANRIAGYYAASTPATPVMDIIKHIPRALGDVLEGKDISFRKYVS